LNREGIDKSEHDCREEERCIVSSSASGKEDRGNGKDILRDDVENLSAERFMHRRFPPG
jgi:hypothetical protein